MYKMFSVSSQGDSSLQCPYTIIVQIQYDCVLMIFCPSWCITFLPLSYETLELGYKRQFHKSML